MEVNINNDEILLIIPDIHEKYDIAESIIKKVKPDKTIFLGDYFDDFDNNDQKIKDTARWLSRSLKKESRIHLVGNHDVGYASQSLYLKCTGYTGWKQNIIDKVNIDWDKLHMHCWIGRKFLCTHAGLSNRLLKNTKISDLLSLADTEWMNRNVTTTKFKMLAAGKARGGNVDCGGITWCDFNKEFDPITNISQIFGHTPGDRVRDIFLGKSENHCLDTHLNDYAIIKNGKFESKRHISYNADDMLFYSEFE